VSQSKTEGDAYVRHLRIVLRAQNQDRRAPAARGNREILHPQSHEFGSPAERVVANCDHRAISVAGQGIKACADQAVTHVLN
jgi:hypothetical protein